MSPSVATRATLAAALALAATALLGAQESAPAPARGTRRPNVVLIVADDLGYGELGCYGQTKMRTPHLDRLASEGLRFTQCNAGAPVCAPSRCVLLTGLHTGHAEIRGNLEARDESGTLIDGQEPLSARAVTLAQVLRRAGYATAAFGKWGLGEPRTTGAPNEQGFDSFFGVTCQRVAHSYYPRFVWRNSTRELLNERPVPGHAKQPDGEVRLEDWQGERHLSTAIRDEALRWIAARKDDPRPFLLYLPFLEPHLAMQPERAFVEEYPQAWDERPYRGQCGYTPHPRPRAGYAAMVSQLDDNAGRILRALDEAGLANDTLVLFTSDNGPTHDDDGDPAFGVGGVDLEFFDGTRGLRGRKGSVYEGGLRVPLIARWPGRIAAGGTCEFPLYFADVLPTLCALAGLEAPRGLDGIDASAVLEGRELVVERTPMVWIFPEYGGQVAVRFGKWKLLRRGIAAKKMFDWELYDLAADPHEGHSVAAANPEIVLRGIAILRANVAENERFPLVIPDVNG